MSSRLKAVAPKAAKPSKSKMLVFGKPNAGKTWFATSFPAVYYIDTEKGANREHYLNRLEVSGGMYLGQDQGANDFAVLLDQIQALATEKHSFKTLVIDSVSYVFGAEIANEQERLDNEKKVDEYGASRKTAIRNIRKIANWLDRVDMNVILVAHQKDEYGMVNGKREAVGVTFDCWDKLEYQLDLTLHAEHIVGPRYIGRVRKTRLLGFPKGEIFDLSFDEFADRYGREIITGDVEHIELASPDQLTEYRELISRVRMPDDWEDKALKYAKADTLEEVGAEDMARMIAKVRERVA